MRRARAATKAASRRGELAAPPNRMHADGKEYHERQHRNQEHHREHGGPTEILPMLSSS